MSPDDPLFPFYAQGARCGHLDGKQAPTTIASVLCLGSLEIAREHETAMGNPDPAHIEAWAKGYEAGYLAGMWARDLEPEIVNAELPKR